MNESIRATIILLARQWPNRFPITRAWTVETLYIIDKVIRPGCLGLNWETRGHYPINHELLHSLDEVGCISGLRVRLKPESVDFAETKVTQEQKEALMELHSQWLEYKDIGGLYIWKAKIKASIK